MNVPEIFVYINLVLMLFLSNMRFASVFLAVWVTGIRMAVQIMNWEVSGWKWSWDIIEINLDQEPTFENGKPP